MRAVTNIVENGIKHATSVTVALNETNQGVEIEIADNGPGIPAKLHGAVFEPFFKTDHARSPNGAGFGLGLSIAQDIVKRHGGEISLRPREPSGLVVRIFLAASKVQPNEDWFAPSSREPPANGKENCVR